MGTVTTFTKARLEKIERETIISGRIDAGNLILKTRAGIETNLGKVSGFTDHDLAVMIGTTGSESQAAVRTAVGPVSGGAKNLALLNDSAWSGMVAALPYRTTRLVKWVTLGSSTTLSAALAEVDRYPAKVLAMLQKAYPHTVNPSIITLGDAATTPPTGTGIIVINGGISGSQSSTYLTSVNRQRVAALAPDVISHMIGANDFANGITVANFKSNILSHLAAFDALGVTAPHLFFHTFARFDDAALAAKVAEWSAYLDALLEIAASRADTSVLDLSRDFAAIRIPGSDTLKFMGPDKIHLTEPGQVFMAETIRRRLSIPMPAVVSSGGTTTPPATTTPTAPVTEPTRSIVTSDSFSGTSGTNMAGRSTDTLAGDGSAMVWQSSGGDSWGLDSLGRLIRSVGATEFIALPVSQANFDAEFDVPVLSSASGTILLSFDFRRVQMPSGGNGLRLRMRSNGSMTLSEVLNGAETSLYEAASGTLPAAGRVKIRALNDRVSLSVNGSALTTVPVNLIAAGYLGFAKSSTITAATFDNLAVYALS